MNTTTILKDIYHDASNPAGLGGVRQLYREARKRNKNITLRDVKEFLQQSRTYTLHKSTRKRFPRRKILAPKPRVIMTCDLGDFSALQKHNKGVKYILFCLDVFSRYLQVAPLTSKSGQNTVSALRSILESEESKGVSRLFTDLGTEFYNSRVKDYLSRKRVRLYSNESRETKASLAERVIRTIKTKLYKFLTLNNTLTYIHILPSLVNAYNRTPHSGLGLQQTPTQVHQIRDLSHIKAQFKRMYLNRPTIKKHISSDLTVGDIVRLQSVARTQFKFNKAYTVNNTEELFKIVRTDTSQNIPTYYLEDLEGEEVKGAFYRDELIKTSLPDTYQVDILKSRTHRGKKQYMVHWRGYPRKFDSWVDASALLRYDERTPDLAA